MSGLILPNQPPVQSPGPSTPDILDSEMLEIEAARNYIAERTAGKRLNLEDTDKMIVEVFHKIGWVVDVKWWTSSEHGYIPDVEIRARVEEKEFDHDQMVHEVTSDLLGIEGGGGVIKS